MLFVGIQLFHTAISQHVIFCFARFIVGSKTYYDAAFIKAGSGVNYFPLARYFRAMVAVNRIDIFFLVGVIASIGRDLAIQGEGVFYTCAVFAWALVFVGSGQ